MRQSQQKSSAFSHLLKFLRSLYGKQCKPRSDCSYSGSTLFASILNLSVMLGNYCNRRLQQTTFLDTFFLGALRVNCILGHFVELFPKILSRTASECHTVWIQIRPRGYKKISCSTQLSTDFQLLIKLKC